MPSKRRNPLLADFFHRLKLMERRGSGMKKIIGEYKRYEDLENYHAPEFSSNASEFHAVLWNLNYGTDAAKEFVKEDAKFNRVGGKRNSFSPTFVFRPLTPPYMRFRIRRFLFWVPFEV